MMGKTLRGAIRAQIMAKLPSGAISESELDGLIDKVLSEDKPGVSPASRSSVASVTSSATTNMTNTLISRCAQWCREHTRTVAFPDALDERVLAAVQELAEQRYVNPVLVGNVSQIRDMAKAKGYSLAKVRIVDPADSPTIPQYSERLQARMRGRAGISTIDDARRQLRDPLWFAAVMLDAGDVDAVVAGNLSATAEVLRAALRVIGPASGVDTVSSLFFMLQPGSDQVLAFADCGVVPQPTTEQLADIAISTADSFQNVVNQEPRVAMLSFSTMGSVKHDAVRPPRDAVPQVASRRPDLLIEGEMQFDAAFCPDVAARKIPDSVLGGQANVFVFPDLNAGNIAYKVAQRMGGYSALGPMIQGLRLPMHDVSRGCSAQDIVHVSLLAVKMAFGGEKG